MRLADFQIRDLCQGDRPLLSPFDEDCLNPASYDLRLGHRVITEALDGSGWRELDISYADEASPFWLNPGEFALAESLEIINLPDDIVAQFLLKSSRARQGLGHAMAGYCDPGWHGSKLTLELKNYRQCQSIPLWPGMKIGQLAFTQMAAAPERSYAVTGRYNNQPHVQGSLG